MSSIRLYFFLQDNDTPLTYQFHYKTDNGLYTVVSYGSEDHVTTVLPSGRKDNNYDIDFEITVTDSLSAATTILRKVKVRKIFHRGSLTMHAIASLSSSRFPSYKRSTISSILLFHHTSTIPFQNVQVRNANPKIAIFSPWKCKVNVITCAYLPSDSNSFINKAQVINKSFYQLRFDFCAVICCRIKPS